MTRALRQLGYEPIVANPRKLKAISANEHKSDRNDAHLLAKLATADATLLHPVHHRSEAREHAMAVMHARDALVRERSRLISKIRSMCKGVGARLKSGGADAFVHREEEVPAVLVPGSGSARPGTSSFVGCSCSAPTTSTAPSATTAAFAGGGTR